MRAWSRDWLEVKRKRISKNVRSFWNKWLRGPVEKALISRAKKEALKAARKVEGGGS